MCFALLRPILVLLVAAFMMMAGMGTLATVLGIRLVATGSSTLVIGLVMGAYWAGLTLGSIYTGRLIKGVGHIRCFGAAVAAISAATLLHAMIPGAAAWGVLRLVEGVCMAGVFVCMESWLNQKATSDSRGQILAFYMISLYAGQASGQTLLLLEDGQGPTIFLALSVLLSLAMLPVTLTRQTPPTLPDIVSFGLRRLYQASPLGLAGVVAAGLVGGAVVNMAPVVLVQSGRSVGDTALFMSAVILGGVLLQWPLGRLSDLFDRRTVLVSLFIALAVMGMSMALTVEAGFGLMLTGGVLFGGIIFTLYPVSVAHTNDWLRPADIVPASGGLVLGYSIGAAAGPFAASLVIDSAGPGGLFLFSAGMGLLAALFGLWRMLMRPPQPGERQSPYQTLPQTTPVAAPLDPRGPLHPRPHR